MTLLKRSHSKWKRPLVNIIAFGGDFVARIPNEVIDQVRNSVDIADVIGQDVQLRKQGRNLMGHCPFHQDDTPSFSVNEEKQFFYCFSCHRTGNVFSFLQQLHDMTFPEAVKHVAEMVNIEIPELDNSGQATTSPNTPFYQLYDLAADLYHHILVNTKAGQPALRYLEERGMSRELIDQFKLGYAPSADDHGVLAQFLGEKQVDYQVVRQSGLLATDHDGHFHDRFVDRVMYPIKNVNGQIIAFSGRLLAAKGNDQAPKYLNSPETPIFNKRQTLFNFDEAKRAVRHEGHLILMEGFMDVISAYGAGVKSGIASMGTSFTPEQISAIQRITNELVVCYDGDDAGQNAIMRALQLLNDQAPTLNLKVVQMPAGLDPDEFVQQRGSEKFQQYIENAEESLTAFQLQYLRRGLNLANQNELLSYLDTAIRVIAQLDQPVAQNLFIKQLADEFDLDQATLAAQLAQVANQIQRSQSKPAPVNNRPQGSNTKATTELVPPVTPTMVNRVQRAEQLLIYWFIYQSEWRGHLLGLADFSFPDEDYQRLFEQLQTFVSQHDEYLTGDMINFLQDQPQLIALLAEIEQLEVQDEINDEMVDDCIHVLQAEAPLEVQIKEKQTALKEATALNDQTLSAQLTTELISLYQRQQQVKAKEIN